MLVFLHLLFTYLLSISILHYSLSILHLFFTIYSLFFSALFCAQEADLKGYITLGFLALCLQLHLVNGRQQRDGRMRGWEGLLHFIPSLLGLTLSAGLQGSPFLLFASFSYSSHVSCCRLGL